MIKIKTSPPRENISQKIGRIEGDTQLHAMSKAGDGCPELGCHIFLTSGMSS